MNHSPPDPAAQHQPGYFERWRRLRRESWLYLAHAALLTASLSMTMLVFNLAVLVLDLPPLVVLGQELPMLGVLGSLSVAAAAVVALPLLWLINRIGFWWAMLANALLQAASMFIFALLPMSLPLMFAVSLTGVGGVLFQISSVPFMARLSDDATRDHLFSANFAVNFIFAGMGSLLSGHLAEAWIPQQFDVAPGSALVYQVVFMLAGAGLLLSLIPLLLIGSNEARRAQRASTEPEAGSETGTDRQTVAVSAPTEEPRSLLRFVPEPWRGLLRHPWPLLRLMISPLLISFGAALLIPYFNVFFARRFDVADDMLGLIFAALNITIGLSALAGPLISIRIGKMPTIVLAQALSLPFLLAIGFAPLLWVSVGAALARAALFNMISPLYDAFAMEQTEEALRPTVIGAINGSFASAYIVMPLVSTRVQEDYGFAPLFVATAACYLLATLANYVLFVRGHAAAA